MVLLPKGGHPAKGEQNEGGTPLPTDRALAAILKEMYTWCGADPSRWWNTHD